jgi:hypothetical protein
MNDSVYYTGKMEKAVRLSPSHLIYGVCLPLAILLGYLLASPFESGTIAVVALVLSVLSVPIFMKWYHPMLIFSCNAMILPLFVPGRPMLWMIMAAISMFFLLLNRSLGQGVQFFRARNVAMALIFLTFVVFATAYMTGGVGFAILGSRNAGGKRYLYILLGVMVYFGMSSTTIKRKYAGLAAAVYFLSALTGLVSYLAAAGGPAFYFLVDLFPIESAVEESSNQGVNLVGAEITRLQGLGGVAMGLVCFLLVRYGVRGILDFAKPWRMLVLLVAIAMNLYSGFRSNMITFMALFALMFYLEGLFSTRYFPILVLSFVLAATVAVPYVQNLPLPIQRTLCFLPINVDPRARLNAQDSTDWRVQMWKEVIPTVPQYLIKGKGYTMDANDEYLLDQASKGGFVKSYDGAMLAGDYHNGPLSVIIPFGLFGAAAFVWFLAASVKALRLNYYYGDPSLLVINRFLLAFFIIQIFAFFVIFGSLYSQLSLFTGLIGLSVSLNGGVARPPSPARPYLSGAKN